MYLKNSYRSKTYFSEIQCLIFQIYVLRNLNLSFKFVLALNVHPFCRNTRFACYCIFYFFFTSSIPPYYTI